MSTQDGSAVRLEAAAIGFPTALATAVGLIIAGSVLLTAQTGFGAGGYIFAWAILIAFILMLAQSASFSEAAGILPTAGSVYDYVAAGMGRFFAITGSLAAYLLVHVFAGVAETATAGVFASFNFGFLEGFQESGSWWIGIALVVILSIVNMVGIRPYASTEIGMTAFMWATLIIFGIGGLLAEKKSSITGFFGESFVGTDITAILTMVGLALFLFVGVEYVTPLASELREPSRTIPKAMYIGVTAVALAMFLYGAAVARQVENVDLGDGTFILDTPLAIPEFAQAVMGDFGQVWLGIAVLLASAATLNTVIAGVSRIFYGMAKDGTLPKAFGYLHPRYKEPWIGIFLVALIAIVGAVILDGDVPSIINLILAAVMAWIFSYVLVNISVMILRARRPDLDRPYKTPLYPLPQIVASVGMLVAAWYIAPPGLTRADIYTPFFIMLGACALYALIWTYGIQKTNPWAPVDPELLKAEEGIST
ncbi:MAG TPA: APC family permease [Acidimicrobiia bacterium]|nr:APC family permease [Acidimicrobiia bacterium]